MLVHVLSSLMAQWNQWYNVFLWLFYTLKKLIMLSIIILRMVFMFSKRELWNASKYHDCEISFYYIIHILTKLKYQKSTHLSINLIVFHRELLYWKVSRKKLKKRAKRMKYSSRACLMNWEIHWTLCLGALIFWRMQMKHSKKSCCK